MVLPKGSDEEDDDDKEGRGKAGDDNAGHDADVRRMLEREREGRDNFYKSKDSLNNDNFISPFGSQFKLLAVVPHRLLAARATPCRTTPPHSCRATISLLALRLSHAGWLLHRLLSRCTTISLAPAGC